MRICFALLLIFSQLFVAAQNENLIVYFGGQSNGGTDPNTGQNAAIYTPEYMRLGIDNVFFYDIAVANNKAFVAYQTNLNAWGWLDQCLYVLSKSRRWKNIFVIKRSVGGTKLAVRTGGSAYPRSDFQFKANEANGILPTLLDTSKCDRIVLWDQCESDATLQVDAVNYGRNLTDWFRAIRDTMGLNYSIVFKRLGNLQKDFPFWATLQLCQDSVKALSNRNYIINTNNLRMWGNDTGPDNYRSGDFSHHRSSTAVVVGNRFADTVLSIFNGTKNDRVKPQLVSARIDTSGNFVTLLFNEPINATVAPFYRQFTIGTKIFDTITVAGNEMRLRATVPFYAGITYTLRYTKDTLFSENIQDLEGNELNSIPALSITNNATATQPSLTTIYTSNFTSSTDSWTGILGDTVIANQTSPSGVTGCLRVQRQNSAGTGRLQRTSMSGFGIGTFRLSFRIEVPDTYKWPANPSGISMSVSNILPTAVRLRFNNLLVRDRMTYLEVQFISTGTNGTFNFDANGALGDTYHIRDITIVKVG